MKVQIINDDIARSCKCLYVLNFHQLDAQNVYHSTIGFVLAPVVQTLDSAIHRINHYLADKY